MPTLTIRNGKLYYEYTPQELEQVRNNIEMQRRLTTGTPNVAKSSPFTDAWSINKSHKKPVAL